MNLQLDQLAAPARDLATRAMRWMDSCWDAEAGLFRMPGGEFYEDGAMDSQVHLVRESAWYALGLLLRGGAGDQARAQQALGALLRYQFDTPGQPYHGTWYRSPHEPHPPLANAVVWDDYDPNWREFIGTTLALILIEYAAQLPAALNERIELALRRAAEGSFERNVSAQYSNIALMSVFLLEFCGARLGVAEWQARAEQLAEQVAARFRRSGCFDEYNSPTYYGVDLYALALWRSYALAPAIRSAGAEIEAALWRDIAQFYHAGMRNIAGPYDRSYGMDMRRYVAGLGMWIWMSSGYEQAPIPDIDQPFEHAWDLAAAPLFALLGAQVPADALPHLLAFQGERLNQRTIAPEPQRVATAWIGERVMLGAEDSQSTQRIYEQFHPATIHWLAAPGQVGWARLRHAVPVDARAAPRQLAIRCSQHLGGDLEFTFEICAPLGESATLSAGRWELPGLSIRVETNAPELQVTRQGELAELRYRAPQVSAGTPIFFTLHILPE